MDTQILDDLMEDIVREEAWRPSYDETSLRLLEDFIEDLQKRFKDLDAYVEREVRQLGDVASKAEDITSGWSCELEGICSALIADLKYEFNL